MSTYHPVAGFLEFVVSKFNQIGRRLSVSQMDTEAMAMWQGRAQVLARAVDGVTELSSGTISGERILQAVDAHPEWNADNMPLVAYLERCVPFGDLRRQSVHRKEVIKQLNFLCDQLPQNAKRT